MSILAIGKFNVRIVTPGQGYGRGFRLAAAETFVEFYDNRYPDPDFGVYGQFVSRYFLTTIAEDKFPEGLSLDGGVPEWWVSAEDMEVVVAFLNKFQREPAPAE